jgi:hypothetical protein
MRQIAYPTLLALLLTTAACSGHPDGVRMVEARIDGLTCDKCVPPLTKSLQKHFTSAKVAVDDTSDTATLQWTRGQAFSADEFGKAVTDVRMRVIELNLEACGRAEASGGDRILTAGDTASCCAAARRCRSASRSALPDAWTAASSRPSWRSARSRPAATDGPLRSIRLTPSHPAG